LLYYENTPSLNKREKNGIQNKNLMFQKENVLWNKNKHYLIAKKVIVPGLVIILARGR